MLHWTASSEEEEDEREEQGDEERGGKKCVYEGRGVRGQGLVLGFVHAHLCTGMCAISVSVCDSQMLLAQ